MDKCELTLQRLVAWHPLELDHLLGSSWALLLIPFPGLLDDARVYNVALTAQEVSSLFAGSNVTRGLVSRWAFNEGSGTVANDTGGGSNNATLWPTNSPPTWSTNEP